MLECPQQGSQPGKLPSSSKLARGGEGTGLIGQGDSASRTVGDIIRTCGDVAVLGIGVGTSRQGGVFIRQY